MSADALSLQALLFSSKQRRLRGACTKRRLYEAAQKDNQLVDLTAQIAMLASSVDALAATSFYQTWDCAGTWSAELDPTAAAFVPASSPEPKAEADTRVSGTTSALF